MRFFAIRGAAGADWRAAGARQTSPADTVLLNGKIITVDENDRIAQAVAIAGGKIVAVGTNDEIRAHVGPSTEQIDLRGRAVTPGLLDAHAHFGNGGAQRLFVLDLSFPNVKSIEDVGQKRARAGGEASGRRVDRRARVGRGQARRAPPDHGARSGSRGRRSSRVPDADHGTLRRRQQRRVEDGGHHEGHARSAQRHDRSLSGRHAHRRAEGIGAGSRAASGAATDRGANRTRHPRAGHGVQRRRHDRRQGSRCRAAGLGRVPPRAGRRRTAAARVRLVVGRRHARRGARGSSASAPRRAVRTNPLATII